MPTRSPGCMPRPCRAPARRATRSWNWAKVQRRPWPVMATACGHSRTPLCTDWVRYMGVSLGVPAGLLAQLDVRVLDDPGVDAGIGAHQLGKVLGPAPARGHAHALQLGEHVGLAQD